MPRRVYRRRRRRRTAPWYRRRYTAMQLATKAAKGVWYLKGLVNAEMHHHIKASSGSITNSGTVLHLTDIAQGDNDAERTGKSIFVRNVFSRLAVEQHASATHTGIRMILFIDTQQVADTSPSVTNVLESTSILSSLNTETAGRFKVLKDWTFYVNDTSSTTRVIKYFKNLRHHVRYNGTAGTDQQKGALYLLYLSDEGTNQPTLYWNIKLGYHDN